MVGSSTWQRITGKSLVLAMLSSGCGTTEAPAPVAGTPSLDAAQADATTGAGTDAAAGTTDSVDAADQNSGQSDGGQPATGPAALCMAASETTYAKEAMETQALIAVDDGHVLLGGSNYFIEKAYPAAGAWAARVDAGQKLLWQRDLRKDEQWRRAVHGAQLADKSLVVVGYSDGELAPGGSFFVPFPRVIKLASDGKTLWTKAFTSNPLQGRFAAMREDGNLQVVGVHAFHSDKVWLATLDANSGGTMDQVHVTVANLYQLVDIARHPSGAIGIAAASITASAGGSYQQHALFTIIDPQTAKVFRDEKPEADTVTAGMWPTAEGFAVVTSGPKKSAWSIQAYAVSGAKVSSYPLKVEAGWAASLAVRGTTANLHLLLEHREPDKALALSHRWTVWSLTGQRLADTPIDSKIGSPWSGGVVDGDSEVVLLGRWDTLSTGSSEATNPVSIGAKLARFKTSKPPCL